MLKRLFKRPVEAPAADHRVPDGQRIYAVGDIHGRLDLLDQLLARIDADDAARGGAETELIFLGDLVDRGPDSAGVVERLRQLKASGRKARFLAGNHEEVFLQAAQGDRQALRFLVRIGGRATVLSYGVSEAEYDAADFGELMELFVPRVPPEHVEFLRSFEDQIVVGDYLFVHAGIRPARPLDEQQRSDLRWIRSDFLDYRGDHGLMVVHGHTITDDVDEQPNRIGIDTGAFVTGRLTAVGLEGAERWYLST